MMRSILEQQPIYNLLANTLNKYISYDSNNQRYLGDFENCAFRDRLFDNFRAENTRCPAMKTRQTIKWICTTKDGDLCLANHIRPIVMT